MTRNLARVKNHKLSASMITNINHRLADVKVKSYLTIQHTRRMNPAVIMLIGKK